MSKLKGLTGDWKFWVSLILDILGMGLTFLVPAASNFVTAPANFLWIKFFLAGSNTLAIVGAVDEPLDIVPNPITPFIPMNLVAYVLYKMKR